jgi:hypothetical protein
MCVCHSIGLLVSSYHKYKFFCCVHMCSLATKMQDLLNIINLPEGLAVWQILNCCYYV